jgi:hypothetical protein
MLGKGAGLSELPYTPYTGQISAGASPLQNQAFSGIAGLTVPGDLGAGAAGAGDIAGRASGMGFDPSQFTSGYVAPDAYGAGQFDSGFTAPAGYTAGSFNAGTFDTAAMNQYMSPFIQGALNPQLDEARRQAEISRVQNAGRMTQAGAFGGSRQAIMESEMDRSLQRNLSDITGAGMMSAYDKAMQAYQTDQQRRLEAEGMGEQSRQFGAGFGLDALSRELQARQAQSQMGRTAFDTQRDVFSTQMDAGATQRDIEQEGIAAAMRQFEQERDYPYKQLQFKQSMLQGLPLEAQNYSYVEPDSLSRFLGSSAGVLSLIRDLNLGGSTGTPTQQYSAEQLAAMEAGG